MFKLASTFGRWLTIDEAEQQTLDGGERVTLYAPADVCRDIFYNYIPRSAKNGDSTWERRRAYRGFGGVCAASGLQVFEPELEPHHRDPAIYSDRRDVYDYFGIVLPYVPRDRTTGARNETGDKRARDTFAALRKYVEVHQ